MNSKIRELRTPEYYYRQYENDFPKLDSEKKLWSNQSLRVLQSASHFVSLYKPLSQPFILVMGGSRAITCLSKTYNDISKEKCRKEIALDVIQSALAVISLGGIIFAYPLGMLVTTCHDLGVNILALHQAWLEKDSTKASEAGFQLLNNCFYLGLFLTGSTEILVASLAMQILSGAYHSYQEYSQGNYIEAFSSIFMVLIRINQASTPVRELHQKWKAAIENRKQSIVNCNVAKADLKSNTSTNIDQDKVVNFIKAYSQSEEKKQGWSETAYAIEKDYDNDVVLFCIQKLGVQNPIYTVKYPNPQVAPDGRIFKHVLITCMRKNRLDIFAVLIDKVNPNEAREYARRDALYRGCSQFDDANERRILNIAIEEIDNGIDFLKILISRGINVNQEEYYKEILPNNRELKDVYRRTALITAILKEKVKEIELLLNANADVNKQGNGSMASYPGYGNRPVDHSIRIRRVDILALLINKGAILDESCLISAIYQRSVEALRLLFKSGVQATSLTLQSAIQSESKELVDLVFNQIDAQ